MKKIIAIILTITMLFALGSISVLAVDEWENEYGCYMKEDDRFGATTIRWELSIGRTSMLTATGVGVNQSVSHTYRTPVNAYAYCEDCDLFGNDQGYGWMGNPGYATAFIDLEGYFCYVGGAEYLFYEDGVLIATRYMSWNYNDYVNNDN